MANIEYAIYKGDSFQFIGTLDECAERLEVKPSFIQWLTTPTGKKRFESRKDTNKALTAVKLKDGD